MSLICDPSYLTHNLRLAYLRHVDDPYGPRTISLHPRYASNPFVLTAGLADEERWPELVLSSSPQPSDDEGTSTTTGYPGANLKYTQTIMGPSKVGALGLRVSGKRLPRRPRRGDNAGDPSTIDSTVVASDRRSVPATQRSRSQSAASNSAELPLHGQSAQMNRVISNLPPAARSTFGTHIDPELSSDEEADIEVDVEAEGELDEFSDYEGIEDDGDEFDPAYTVPQIGVISESTSDAATAPLSFAMDRSTAESSELSGKQSHRGPPADSFFEMVTPLRDTDGVAHGKPHPRKNSSGTDTSEPEFFKRNVPQVRTLTSGLTARLASSSTASSSNPFTELYALTNGRELPSSNTVTVYFPHSATPTKSMELQVRTDATVEEVLGFALWTYWEDGWSPKLDQDPGEEDSPKVKSRLSAIGWIMRVAEEDGEVDEDFPAPDRLGRISQFNFDAFAILEANPAQIMQNQQLQSKITRRPSRIIVAKRRPENGLLVPPPAGVSSAISGSTLGASLSISSSLLSLGSLGPQVYLRVRVADAADNAIHYSTTISVSAGMYMQESLEMVCRKRKLANPNEWALLVSDPRTLIPLDRTVASLQGKSDLILIKRSSLPEYGFQTDEDKRGGRTTDPNASIFKRISEVPEVLVSAQLDFTSAYKRYNVVRKGSVGVSLGRHERTFAFDGDYIHIMPSANNVRAFFDKTTSYHITSVVGCVQSSKSSSSFKFTVKHDGTDKRYYFEAENPKFAAEIVNCVKMLKNNAQRPVTDIKLRRSHKKN